MLFYVNGSEGIKITTLKMLQQTLKSIILHA